MESLSQLQSALKAGQLKGQKRVNLSCGLTEFPLELLELADTLEILDLSNNHINRLPDEFGQLKALRIAFFNNNQFEDFPAILAACPHLSMISFKGNQIHTVGEDALAPNIRWLILTNNRLEKIPAAIGSLRRLQKFMLAGNCLRSLPDELANCKNLELLRIAANQLQTLPDWLLELPRLSWLAYAGNPFCQTLAPEPSSHSRLQQEGDEDKLPIIDPATLKQGAILGQGASGVIYKGEWMPNQSESDVTKPVAIKLFKGDITSDGSPLDEMQACIAAGTHPNLVNVLGKYNRDNQAGLIFSFIPSEYQNLGGPPSLDSCTRDTYSDGTIFSLPVILRIARGIASAIAHLHARGIIHGDIYAHNILVNQAGDCIFGDFGAASFYDPTSTQRAAALERLESRAFGCLLEDLLDRYVPDTGDTGDNSDAGDTGDAGDARADEGESEARTVERLRQLQIDCMNPEPALRPLFVEICSILTDPLSSEQ